MQVRGIRGKRKGWRKKGRKDGKEERKQNTKKKSILTLIHKNLMWNRPVHDIKLQPAKVGKKTWGITQLDMI